MEALVADLQQRLLRLEEDARRKDEYIVQLEHRIAAIENSPQVSLPDETHDVIDLTDARLSVLEADDVGSAVASEHSDADIERLPLQSEDDLSEKFGLAPFIDRIPPLVRDYMRPHQRVGAAFLASVLSSNSGSVFADALGLGKTLQVLSAVHVLWCEHAVSRILIVVPSTVIPHWCDEIRSFNSLISGQGIRPFRYPTLIESTVPLDARASIVKPWAQSGGILLVSYGIFCELMNQATVRALLCDDPGAQCLILDEGHRICNAKTHNHSYLSRLPTRRRVVISGYPLQNQLRELYTLVDFVDREKCLKVLGTYKQFQTLFEVPIIKLRSKNVAKARGRSFVLYELLRNNQLFFRRDGSLLQRFLPKKTELVISIRLSSCQRELWLRFLNRRVGLDGVSMHNIATMIADHPEIARRQATSDPTAPCRDWLSDTVPDSLDITSSGKMVVLMQLILQSKAAGDKIVIFSRWVKALSFIEELIGAYNSSNASRGTIRALRFDGSTSMVERQNLIDEFMASSSTADCFLISTLCGEGISLVAANRAVLLEVNWNPSVDFQAASRVFRLGQKKPVFIYRFVMHDMFEEKVFERQLEKVELTNWVLDAADIDVDGNLDTRWSEFLKPPAPITDIVGPTAVNVPSDALRDPVTSSILQRHGMGPGDVAGDNDAKWIVSVTDHSRFFLENDHFELPGAEDVDPLLAREELEYDRVYPRGTPSRSNPEVNVTFSASARRPLSIASVDAEREGTKSAERDPQHGSVPAEALEVLFGRSSSSCESEKNLPNRTAVIDGQGHTSLSASGAIRQLEDLPERSFQSLPDSVELSAAAAEFPSNADHVSGQSDMVDALLNGGAALPSVSSPVDQSLPPGHNHNLLKRQLEVLKSSEHFAQLAIQRKRLKSEATEVKPGDNSASKPSTKQKRDRRSKRARAKERKLRKQQRAQSPRDARSESHLARSDSKLTTQEERHPSQGRRSEFAQDCRESAGGPLPKGQHAMSSSSANRNSSPHCVERCSATVGHERLLNDTSRRDGSLRAIERERFSNRDRAPGDASRRDVPLRASERERAPACYWDRIPAGNGSVRGAPSRSSEPERHARRYRDRALDDVSMRDVAFRGNSRGAPSDQCGDRLPRDASRGDSSFRKRSTERDAQSRQRRDRSDSRSHRSVCEPRHGSVAPQNKYA